MKSLNDRLNHYHIAYSKDYNTVKMVIMKDICSQFEIDKSGKNCDLYKMFKNSSFLYEDMPPKIQSYIKQKYCIEKGIPFFDIPDKKPEIDIKVNYK
jgi:hypothetical protein